MERAENEIYCEVHTCIHEETNDPYRYGFKETGETPECESKHWRKIWVGAYVNHGGKK